MKTVGAKGRQIFVSGKVKENKFGAKERQIFFSGKAKQNKVTLFLKLYFVSFYR